MATITESAGQNTNKNKMLEESVGQNTNKNKMLEAQWQQ